MSFITLSSSESNCVPVCCFSIILLIFFVNVVFASSSLMSPSNFKSSSYADAEAFAIYFSYTSGSPPTLAVKYSASCLRLFINKGFTIGVYRNSYEMA